MKKLLRRIVVLMVLMWLWTVLPAVRGALVSPLRLAQGVVASVELHQLSKMLFNWRASNGAFPPTERFASLVRESFSSSVKDPLLDAWGVPYVYQQTENGFVLASCGPDHLFGSNDDLTYTYEVNSL